MNDWNNEKIQRGIDAYIATNQLFTSELKENIQKRALQRERTLQRKQRAKRKSFLISIACSLTMTTAVLFFVLHQAETHRQVEEPPVTTASSTEAIALFSELMNKALKGFSAVGTNNFDMMKQYFHSDVLLDEVNKTVQFAGDIEPLQTNYFPVADLKDIELLSAFEQTKTGMYVMLRVDFNSFEIYFQRDPLNEDDYRITAIVNAN